jgi:hypothetical protein
VISTNFIKTIKKKKGYKEVIKGSPPRHTLSNPANLHIRKQQLETITQRAHIRVRVTLKLITLWDNFDIPALQFGVLAGFETEEEIAWVFGVDAKGVDGALGVGHGVGCEPFFCSN